MISYAGGKRPPHTGAALLALRAEFYRQRIKRLLDQDPEEAHRLLEQFQIEDAGPLTSRNTWIVPVCLSYFPIRARENTLSNSATHLVNGISDRLVEEIMTEGTMLLSGVDRSRKPSAGGRRSVPASAALSALAGTISFSPSFNRAARFMSSTIASLVAPPASSSASAALEPSATR